MAKMEALLQSQKCEGDEVKSASERSRPATGSAKSAKSTPSKAE